METLERAGQELEAQRGSENGQALVDETGQGVREAARPVATQVRFPVRPRFLRVGGLRISYFDIGDGPVVLLVHGFGDSLHGWRRIIGPLVDAGHRVMAVDLPGFGYSDRPGGYSLDRYTRTLQAWLDLHCIDEVALVGNSMGGTIATHFAGQHPERVTHLVLIDPAGFYHDFSWMLRVAAIAIPTFAVPRRMSKKQISLIMRRFISADPSCVEDEDIERITELVCLPGFREAFIEIARKAAGLRGLKPGMGLGEMPEKVDVPSLIVWGDRDRLTPISHAEQVRSHLGGAELVVFEGCGHCPQREMPERLAERIVDFVHRGDATNGSGPAPHAGA